MRITNIKCTYCGNFLQDISGLGESQKLMCTNPACPSKYMKKCPNCSSTKIRVKVMGIGDEIFTCEICGNQWSSLEE